LWLTYTVKPKVAVAVVLVMVEELLHTLDNNVLLCFLHFVFSPLLKQLFKQKFEYFCSLERESGGRYCKNICY